MVTRHKSGRRIMQALLLATTLVGLGYIASPASAFWLSKLFGSGRCEDDYLIATNLVKQNPTPPTSARSVYDFFAKDIDGNVVGLRKYEGKVLMVVNAAS